MKKDKKDGFSRLPFEISEQIDESMVTAHTGVPLVIELFRASRAESLAWQSLEVAGR